MGIAIVVCPYCGHETETQTTGTGRVGGVRRRLKQEYRAARHTCEQCGYDFDIRRA